MFKIYDKISDAALLACSSEGDRVVNTPSQTSFISIDRESLFLLVESLLASDWSITDYSLSHALKFHLSLLAFCSFYFFHVRLALGYSCTKFLSANEYGFFEEPVNIFNIFFVFEKCVICLKLIDSASKSIFISTKFTSNCAVAFREFFGIKVIYHYDLLYMLFKAKVA